MYKAIDPASHSIGGLTGSVAEGFLARFCGRESLSQQWDRIWLSIRTTSSREPLFFVAVMVPAGTTEFRPYRLGLWKWLDALKAT
jgi:hypothetical protein